MGGFNFKSLDNMVSGILEKTTFEKGDVRESNKMDEFPKLIFKPSTGADDVPLRTQIQSIQIPQKFDTLGGTIGGAYSSYQFSYDPISKIDIVNHLFGISDRSPRFLSGSVPTSTPSKRESSKILLLSTQKAKAEFEETAELEILFFYPMA